MNFSALNEKQAALILLDNAAEGQRVLGIGTQSGRLKTVASSTSRGASSKEAGDCTNKSGIIISSLFLSLPPTPLGKVAQF